MFTFGQRLKKLRQEQAFSQSYLAENIGVSIQSVSNWECDTTMPDISQIVPLASILGVSTDFLLGNDCNETVDIEKLEEEVKRIWATYSVNTMENNADYMVCELYRGFLRKYPLNYKIKYKCALACMTIWLFLQCVTNLRLAKRILTNGFLNAKNCCGRYANTI